MKWLKKHERDRIWMILSAIIVIYTYGAFSAVYNIFPFEFLATVVHNGNYLLKFWESHTGLRPSKFLRPAQNDNDGVTIYVSDQVSGGHTFMVGLFDDKISAQLMDKNGSLLNRWEANYTQIWTNTDHVRGEGVPRSDWDTEIHGAIVYANGDIVFNFSYQGLVRMNRCGELVWTVPRMTHHSVHLAEDQTLWVPSGVYHDAPVAEFSNLPAPLFEDTILQISPDGEILQEISILRALYAARYDGLLLNSLGRQTSNIPGDVTHLNDVELLTRADADAFPQFSPGDILVSIRDLHAVLVLDSVSHEIKWAQVGPWIRQHDPDFLPNGRISVYDNRTDTQGGAVLGGSRIVTVDPATRQLVTTYQDSDPIFYTAIRGEHQNLPNGNILISEYDGGRAFEVSPVGDIVWSYTNRYDDDEVALVSDATRYPVEFFDTDFSGCAETWSN